MRYYILLFTVFIFASVLGAVEGDFDRGEAAYGQGAYRSAEVFFQAFLRDDPLDTHIPEAMFYLVKIHELRGDLPAFLSWAQRFLDECEYDNRRQDVFTSIIQKLKQRGAYTLACDYLQRYDFFVIDQETLEGIGFGLIEENEPRLADSVFALCVPSDTVHVLRARLADTEGERRQFYELVSGAKGRLYIIEMLLAIGDTVEAFDIFRMVDKASIQDDLLVRYAAVALLFDDALFSAIMDRLGDMPQYRQKMLLIRALQTGELDRTLTPRDAQECSLLVASLKRPRVMREDFSDLLGTDTVSLDSIIRLKSQYGSHFVLDSLHAVKLLAGGDTTGASRVLSPYVRYVNTSRYVRIVQGMASYSDHDYRRAATHFIVAQVREPHMQFMLAQSLQKLGIDASYLYDMVLSAQDTVLVIAAIKKLIPIRFAQEEYDRVIAYDPAWFFEGPGDTAILRQYIHSLARRGERERAEMLYSDYELDRDDDYVDYYGEYLIETKNFKKARIYYDSLVEVTNRAANFLYNWALVPFMQGAVDTAQARFTLLLERYPDSDDHHRAAFKLATMLYLEEQFDSAAFFYGIAREDSTLARDALRNQLICYKKAGSWYQVVKTGMEILSAGLYEQEHETRFEIGYAWLRAGRPERAVEHLLTAARAHSSPEYYYWLAEAYLAKAAFGRALYFYRTIMSAFPRDEMWTPTAWYKTGIVLEFMDAEDEAKAVYRHIIKTRGAGDTWGTEAQRRIDYLEQ